MFNVFISASIPDLTDAQLLDNFNKKRLYLNEDRLAIKEALFALLHVLLPCSNIIWGGHPSITTIIYEITRDILRQERFLPHFYLYQSDFFRHEFPGTNQPFETENFTLVKGVRSSQAQSLSQMRKKMLNKKRKIDLAVFIGGNEEGLTEELNILQQNHPETLILPLAATGGYTRTLFQERCLCEGMEPPEYTQETPWIILPKELYEKCERYRFYTLFDDAKNLIEKRKVHRQAKEKAHREERKQLRKRELEKIRQQLRTQLQKEVSILLENGDESITGRNAIITESLQKRFKHIISESFREKEIAIQADPKIEHKQSTIRLHPQHTISDRTGRTHSDNMGVFRTFH